MCSLVSKVNELRMVGDSADTLDTLLAELLLALSPRLLQHYIIYPSTSINHSLKITA